MNFNNKLINVSFMTWTKFYLGIRNTVCIFVLIAGTFASINAQGFKYSKPSWWIGGAAGANLNFHRGSTQNLNAEFTPPVVFKNGSGVGLFAGPVLEYHNASGLGLMLQAAYDSKRGSFDQVLSPCNCPADLSTNLSYVSVEPSLRFAPGNSNFYLYGGPRVSFNTAKSFTYKLGINPAFPEQEPTPDVNGDLSDVKSTLISMQIGAGYDIPLNSRDHRIQAVLSPFVAYQPYLGQSPRTLETWNITTFRVGAALKFGSGSLESTTGGIMDETQVSFTVNSPKNIPTQRAVTETFPLRNYVFFDLGSTKIPERYVMIDQEQAKGFKEDQPEVFSPKKLSGRSNREMMVYYNVLNITGERMVNNPSSTITLVGSSEKGPKDGLMMAESVRDYISGVFSLDTSRIHLEGRDKPKIPSEQPGATLELDLLRAGDRRVTIESNSPALLMQFENGKTGSMNPVQINSVQNSPLDSYVSFSVGGASKSLTSWSLAIKDKKGMVQNFGPYTQEKVFIPGKTILGDKTEGDYRITMTGNKIDGTQVVKSTTTNIMQWTPTKDETGMRYSILYEFNDSKAINLYEKYLADVLSPKIPLGSKVLIHGYTDIIGNEASNYELSLARAHNVHNIIQNSLNKAGRKDVTFEVYGFGEDEVYSPFDNKYPEERFYNRTVIIDIIPKK